MSWHKITLGVRECDIHQVEDLELKFDALFMAAGCPPGMALFAAPAKDGGLELYFTPDASVMAGELLKAYGGHNCEPPRAEHVELVEGFRNARRRLCA